MPRVAQRTVGRPSFACDTLAGRYMVLAFFLTSSDPLGAAAVEAIARQRQRFDDRFASLLAVSIDPADEAKLEGRQAEPGVRFLWDFDTSVSRPCGAVPMAGSESGPKLARRFWLVVDPTLHVLAKVPFDTADPEHSAVFELLDRLPPPSEYAGAEIPPPILILPNVFEPEFCRRLVGLYDEHGGKESGVVRDHKQVIDAGFKRRKDYAIEDRSIIDAAIARIRRRVAPELERVFFHKATRIERHIVGCYDAEDGGHFAPHRDNDPGLTMHRQFAVSINLTGDFEGGGVRFPEYSLRGHKAPAGWALIFPCAVLHAVYPVTRGRRYAYLPFLYDDAAAAQRDRADAQAAAGLPIVG